LTTLQDLLSTEEQEKVLKDIAGTVLDVVLNGVKAGGVNLHVNMKAPASDKLRATGLKNYRKKNRIMPIMTLYINMVCYRIVAVYAKVGSNKFRVNMLMDDGSCSSFITRLLCDWLGITGKGKPNPLEVGFLAGSSAVEDFELVTIQLESLDGTLITTVELNRVEEINNDIPIPDFNKMKAKFKYLKDLYVPKLEDAPVMILLGFDHASKQAAMTPDKVGPNPTDPTGRTTAFGNTISYGAKRSPAVQLFGTESQEETQKVSNHQLDQSCKALHELDNLGLIHRSKTEFLSKSDKEAVRIIDDRSYVLPSGHFCMPCPFDEFKKQKLPRNYLEVKRSTEKQELKMKDKAPENYKQLHETHQEWLAKGYVKDISMNVDKREGFYIPKVLVFKQDRDTTKLRICFDCSRPYGPNKMSLNDALHVGPKLQGDILTILILFRDKPMALCADVSQMYPSIKFAEEDKKFH
jgi:hypothetical protein